MRDFSAILLAGGRSSRMGSDKALLTYGGMSLLEWQIKKLRSLGIEDIMLSGRTDGPKLVRCIPDELPGRGPLGGLHACLKKAKNPHCLVLSVDVPLVPEDLLRELAREHTDSDAAITIIKHGEKWEPLIGVYDSAIFPMAEVILSGEDWSVRKLLKTAGYRIKETFLDEALFCNCNTPEDYEKLCYRG